MLSSFAKSGGTTFFDENAAVYYHVEKAADTLPRFPNQGDLNREDFAGLVAEYYNTDMVVRLRKISHTSVTNGTDKAVRVRIYTQSLMRKVQSALGDSDVASVICQDLPELAFASAMYDLAHDDATTVMHAWRKTPRPPHLR